MGIIIKLYEQFLLFFFELFGVSPNSFMDATICNQIDWFRFYVYGFGTYVALIYLGFAVHVLFVLRVPLGNILTKAFPLSLGIVFLLCATNHYIHSHAYIDELIKILLLFTYPLLAIAHTWLLVTSLKAVKLFLELKSKGDLVRIQEELEQYRQSYNQLRNAVMSATIAQSWSEIERATKQIKPNI